MSRSSFWFLHPARLELERLQVQMCAGTATAEERLRVCDILAEHGVAWVEAALGWGLAQRVSVGWHAGNIGRVRMSAKDFVVCGEAIAQKVPLQCVEISRLGAGGLSPLLACSHLAALSALGLCDQGLGDQDALVLSTCPHLAGLRWLDLEENDIGDEGFRALYTSTVLKQVEWLGLDGNPLSLNPRPGGTDRGQVMDTHWPFELGPWEEAPRWAQRNAEGDRLSWPAAVSVKKYPRVVGGEV